MAGPFTVDSLSPHRTLAMDIDDGLIDGVREPKAEFEAKSDFAAVMLQNLKSAGVQQAHKATASASPESLAATPTTCVPKNGISKMRSATPLSSLAPSSAPSYPLDLWWTHEHYRSIRAASRRASMMWSPPDHRPPPRNARRTSSSARSSLPVP